MKFDENLPEVHCSLGYIYTVFDWKFRSAKKEFQKAIELNPRYGPARYWYSNLLMLQGQMEEAIEELRSGSEYDPLSVYMKTHFAVVFFAARKYKEASEYAQQALELDPNAFIASAVLGAAYYLQSNVQDSIRELQRAINISDRHQWPVSRNREGLCCSG